MKRRVIIRRKANFLGFGRKKEARKCAAKSKSALPQSLHSAYLAGFESPDTGLFDQWACDHGYASHGRPVLQRLRAAYDQGFDDRLAGRPASRYAGAGSSAAQTAPGRSPSSQAPSQTTRASTGTKVKSSGTGKEYEGPVMEYRGKKIFRTPTGDYRVSSDPYSRFDTVDDAKRFLDEWATTRRKKHNSSVQHHARRAARVAKSVVKSGLDIYDTLSTNMVTLPAHLVRHYVSNPDHDLDSKFDLVTHISAAGERTMPNPSAAPGSLATLAESSANAKVGMASATYVSNASCPNQGNSSRPCPFLGYGCYAEYGPTNITRLRLNRAANSSGADAEDCARAEAEAIKTQIEINERKGKWLPLRLHVVGDAVGNGPVRMLADACQGWREKVWAYTHAWRDTSRSSWGSKISVLASCETAADAKEAMSRGWGTAMVVDHFKQKGLYKDEETGVWIQPCPNEAIDKNIQCVGSPGHKKCGMCLDDARLRSRGIVIAFDAHSGGAKKVKNAIARIEKEEGN